METPPSPRPPLAAFLAFLASPALAFFCAAESVPIGLYVSQRFIRRRLSNQFFTCCAFTGMCARSFPSCIPIFAAARSRAPEISLAHTSHCARVGNSASSSNHAPSCARSTLTCSP